LKLIHAYRVTHGVWMPSAALLSDLDEVAAGVGPADWPVDVAWVEDDAMTQFNRGYREKDGVTDVLSFGNLELSGIGRPDIRRGEGRAFADLYRDPVEAQVDAVIGELVLAPIFIHERCRENGWDYPAELRLLIAHGLLHLLGWDHMEDLQAARMRKHETEILGALGFDHPMTGDIDREKAAEGDGNVS
jgi:probable rRNA maturation factor